MQNINFQSVFDTPTTPLSKLGAIGQTPDGRMWRYLKTTEAVSQYMVVTRPANTTVTSVSSSTDGINSIYITKASAGWTVGDYQDHWLLVNTGTGTGQAAMIKDNTADTLELYLDYALGTALTTAGSSGIAIVHENDAEKSAISVAITKPRGVAQVAFASGDYGWFLARGIGGVLAGEAITINVTATPGDDTEGSVKISVTAKGTFDEAAVGRCLVANSAADLAFLCDINCL